MLTHRPNASRTAKLVELVEEIEARGNQAFVGSILLLHSNKLYHEAAPHLPARYIEAINGIEIGPATGSCGAAAYCGQPIYVSNIGADQLWSALDGNRGLGGPSRITSLLASADYVW